MQHRAEIAEPVLQRWQDHQSQSWYPMPIGSGVESARDAAPLSSSLFVWVACIILRALSRSAVAFCVFVLGPINPSPPAFDTATASSDPPSTRIGAPTIKGV